MKKVLVISYNAVPVPGVERVEGTGLRGWRLALGLKKYGIKNITLAIKEDNAPDIDSYQGIRFAQYDIDTTDFNAFLTGYDTIIFPFAFGRLSVNIVENAPATTQLICDAYSPYYVEALTKSKDTKEDQRIQEQYKDQIVACSRVLLGSDFALVANERQQTFYEGLISGLGAAPYYKFDRLLQIPAFVENEVKQEKKITKPLKILWFGGMYPWFNALKLIEIFADERVSNIAHLYVVGGWNPMYPKDNIRFNGQYKEFRRAADENKLTDRIIFFHDWVDYDDRLKYFYDADLAVSINTPGPETKYSFRLRVADLAGNGVPIITNGGDHLSDLLVATDRALYYDFLNAKPDTFFETISSIDKINKIQKNLNARQSQRDLHLDAYLPNLIGVIQGHRINRLDVELAPTILDDYLSTTEILAKAYSLQEENKAELKRNQQEIVMLKDDLKKYMNAYKQEQENFKLLRIMRRPIIILKRSIKKQNGQ